MQIPNYLLQKFKGEYKKQFGYELSDNEALERFSRLINVMRIIQELAGVTMEDIEAMPDDPPHLFSEWIPYAVQQLEDSQRANLSVPDISRITWQY